MEIKEPTEQEFKEEITRGDPYLYIRILDSIVIRAFRNDNKTKQQEPDFKGNGVAVWINYKNAVEVQR